MIELLPELLEAAEAHDCEHDEMMVCRHCETIEMFKRVLGEINETLRPGT